VQLISAVDAAVRFLHCCLSAAMSFSVIRCLPDVFTLCYTGSIKIVDKNHHDISRSTLLFNILHPSVGRPVNLFPFSFHYTFGKSVFLHPQHILIASVSV